MGGAFDDKVVWITGGGSGIGRALALELAGQGALVAVSGRRQERLDEVAAEIEALGKKALAVQCDVTDEEAVKGAVEAVVAGLGRLDVAVANAGFGVAGAFERLTVADWRRQMEVNVIGAVATALYALPELRKNSGRLVFVASVMSFLGMPGQSAYAGSKFALRGIGLSLAQELSGSGVSCTTIYPGFVESEIAKVDNKGEFKADRKDPRPSRLMWPTDRAARAMAKAIRKRKREYVFTKHGKIGAWFGRHAPWLIHFVMTRAGVKRQALRDGH